MQSISIQCFSYDYHYDKTYFFLYDRGDIRDIFNEVVRLCQPSRASLVRRNEEDYFVAEGYARCLVTMLGDNGEFERSEVMNVKIEKFLPLPALIRKYIKTLPLWIKPAPVPKMKSFLNGFNVDSMLSNCRSSFQKRMTTYKSSKSQEQQVIKSLSANSDATYKIIIAGLLALVVLLIVYIINHS